MQKQVGCHYMSVAQIQLLSVHPLQKLPIVMFLCNLNKINSLYSISFLRVFPRNGTSNGKKKEVGNFASRTYLNPCNVCVKSP